MDMMDSRLAAPEELTLRELVDAVAKAKWWIVVIAVIAGIGAGTAAAVLPKTYRVVVVMAAVTTSSGSGQMGALGSLVSQMGGGLSSLAGLSVGGDSKREESVAILQSAALSERYIEQNNLVPVLFAGRWNAATGHWKETDAKRIPTLWQADQLFMKRVRNVTIDPKTMLVTLTVDWRNPATATMWANGLVKMANDYLRKKAIDESERNIAYLTEQANKTDVVGVRQGIYTLLQSEINKGMLARGSDEYAFKVLDPAIPPEKPASPIPLVWISVAVFLAVILSILAIFARTAWAKTLSPRPNGRPNP